MKYIKTILLLIIGWILILLGMYYSSFRSFDLKYLTEDRCIIYDNSNITNNIVVNTGINVNGGHCIVEKDDAFFVLKMIYPSEISSIDIQLSGVNGGLAKIYYSIDNQEMSPDQYWEFNAENGVNVVNVNIPSLINYIRLDISNKAGDEYNIDKIKVNIDSSVRYRFYVFTILFIVLYSTFILAYFFRSRIKNYLNSSSFFKFKYDEIDQIMSLAKSDFKGRFSGSYLGVIWGVIQPLSTILLFWFVFQVGFRSGTITGYPFILWLAAGMIPWNYFYDSWFGGTNTFTNYGYIVKKVVFKIEYLPLVRALSSLILNVIFNIILIIIYTLYGHFMGVHIVDMVYFSFCIFMLSLGLSYITATLNVFIKDVSQFMGIALQILMWMTPMMWQYTMIPEGMSWLYKLNPLHYIINGYRESLIQHYFFYHQWKQMIYFWVVTIVILYVGRKTLYKLKDHFADVL